MLRTAGSRDSLRHLSWRQFSNKIIMLCKLILGYLLIYVRLTNAGLRLQQKTSLSQTFKNTRVTWPEGRGCIILRSRFFLWQI